MFDISWSEFLLIGVVALIVIGPKELPAVMRTLGQWTRKVRSMAADFQNQFQEAMREAEMADLKNEVDDLAHKVRSADPVKNVHDDFEAMGSEFARSLDTSAEQASPAGETAPALATASAEPQPLEAPTIKGETSNAETAKAEKAETAKAENAKPEIAKAESPKAESPKAESEKLDTARDETAIAVAEPVPATADVAPARVPQASAPNSPPRTEDDETEREAGVPEPVADATTRRTG